MPLSRRQTANAIKGASPNAITLSIALKTTKTALFSESGLLRNTIFRDYR